MQLTTDDLANGKIDRQKDNNYCQVYFPSAFVRLKTGDGKDIYSNDF